MLKLPPRPVLDWKTIAARAREFAESYRLADRSFPLDVEEIVECDLGMEIRLCAGVMEEFGSPAQIAPGGDKPIITVDADQYRQQTSFYRFSLAHEVGHYALHREWLEKIWRMNAAAQARIRKSPAWRKLAGRLNGHGG